MFQFFLTTLKFNYFYWKPNKLSFLNFFFFRSKVKGHLQIYHAYIKVNILLLNILHLNILHQNIYINILHLNILHLNIFITFKHFTSQRLYKNLNILHLIFLKFILETKAFRVKIIFSNFRHSKIVKINQKLKKF